jgi:hypothetical protein
LSGTILDAIDLGLRLIVRTKRLCFSSKFTTADSYLLKHLSRRKRVLSTKPTFDDAAEFAGCHSVFRVAVNLKSACHRNRYG